MSSHNVNALCNNNSERNNNNKSQITLQEAKSIQPISLELICVGHRKSFRNTQNVWTHHQTWWRRQTYRPAPNAEK